MKISIYCHGVHITENNPDYHTTGITLISVILTFTDFSWIVTKGITEANNSNHSNDIDNSQLYFFQEISHCTEELKENMYSSGAMLRWTDQRIHHGTTWGLLSIFWRIRRVQYEEGQKALVKQRRITCFSFRAPP